jgi:hypothetical protein
MLSTTLDRKSTTGWRNDLTALATALNAFGRSSVKNR